MNRFFYASSACVYAADKTKPRRKCYRSKEQDAYPAMPEDGYGWEKLFSERMCRHFLEDFGLKTRSGAITMFTVRMAPMMEVAKKRRRRFAAK